MDCPFCTHEDTKVLESRTAEASLRRRRECLKCSNRFTTYERAVFNLMVQKRNNTQEPFNLQKLTQAIQRACGKVDQNVVKSIAKRVEQKVIKKKVKPIKSTEIGKLVLRELKRFDTMAYLRFATVYKSIDNPKLLEKELQMITG